MKSTRKGIRDGELEKDTYDRLTCASCGKTLKTENPEDELYSLRFCPECGRKWKQIG